MVLSKPSTNTTKCLVSIKSMHIKNVVHNNQWKIGSNQNHIDTYSTKDLDLKTKISSLYKDCINNIKCFTKNQYNSPLLCMLINCIIHHCDLQGGKSIVVHVKANVQN